MKTEVLAAEAVLLSVEDSVINGHAQGIHFESWDHIFSDGGPLFEALIDYQAYEPFTGANLPSREQVQLVYETYRSRLHILSWMPPTQAYLQAVQIDQFFPAGQAAFAVRPASIDVLQRLLKNEFVL
jgi:hypothetical protein